MGKQNDVLHSVRFWFGHLKLHIYDSHSSILFRLQQQKKLAHLAGITSECKENGFMRGYHLPFYKKKKWKWIIKQNETEDKEREEEKNGNWYRVKWN